MHKCAPNDQVNGVLYFFGTLMDASFLDIFGEAGYPAPSNLSTFALSEASAHDANGYPLFPNCSIAQLKMSDPDSPSCSRITITGEVSRVNKSDPMYEPAWQALLEKHPQDAMLAKMGDHDFFMVMLYPTGIWMIATFGAAVVVPVADYLAVRARPTRAHATACGSHVDRMWARVVPPACPAHMPCVI